MSDAGYLGINSYCSSRPDTVNDKVEAEMIKGELRLDEHGKVWGVSLLSGVGRMVLGTLQAVGAIFFSMFKVGEAAYLGYTEGKEFGALALDEAARGLTYIIQGIANICRGFVEAAQLVALASCCVKGIHEVRLVKYLTESPGMNPTLMREIRLATKNEEESFLYEGDEVLSPILAPPNTLTPTSSDDEPFAHY